MINKTIIVEDSLPIGSDAVETLVFPNMEELAEQFLQEEIPSVPPSAPEASWFQHVPYISGLGSYTHTFI